MGVLRLLTGGLLGFAVLPLLGLCFLHTLLNLRLFRRVRPSDAEDPFAEGAVQDVSVLVPARNEEPRIRACLVSLIDQKPPVREILLLDDRSEDSTARIARELGFREEPGNPLRLIRGEELPEGWVGKNWACHQLSEAADPSSSHLLFTDADTVHSPACIRTALRHARGTGASLLSLWPHQVTGTWSEKLVIPLGYLLFMAFQPFSLLAWLQARPARAETWSRERLASMGAANGQFLLFDKGCYHGIGGHRALRDHLVEDIAFGRRVASRTGEGLRLVNAEGGDLLECRMYRGFRELWEGFSKNLRPVFEESSRGFLLYGCLVGTLFLLPFLLLGAGGEISLLSRTGIALILMMRFLLVLRFRTSWLGFLAHPFGVVLALSIALNSWRLCRKKNVRWKGRVYSGESRSPRD